MGVMGTIDDGDDDVIFSLCVCVCDGGRGLYHLLPVAMARLTGLVLLAVLAAALRSLAWVSPGLTPVPRVGVQRCAQVDPGDCKAVRNDAVSGVQLPTMDEDEPAWLSFVIARYLDEEWVEQPVHKEIGEAVAQIYRESRAEGDDDLIAVLAKLSFGLKDMWRSAGFGDAFEGPVDVANRVAELLMLRQGGEVWSYGRSNSDVQQKMLKRLEEYEEARKQLATVG